MSLGQKHSVEFINSAGSTSRGAPVFVVNKGGYASSASFARPANITAYVAGGAVGAADDVTPANAGSAILEFANVGPVGGSILINGMDFLVESGAIPAGATSFELHLYNAAPDAVLDNAAWDLLSAGDRAKYLGSISLGSPADLGSTLFSEASGIGKQIQLAADGTSLFGVIVSATGYVPVSGTVHAVRLQTTEL